MDIGWHEIRNVQSTDSDEANAFPQAGHLITAPDSYFADRAPCNDLAAAAWRCDDDLIDFSFQHLYAISFNQRIQRESGSCLPLTPTAMATVNDHRIGQHAIADMPACTTTFNIPD